MAYCTYCNIRGHTLTQCYKKPQQHSTSETVHEKHTRGPNGEIIIELVRRQNQDKIQLTSQHDISKITISPNKQKEFNHKNSNIIQHKLPYSSGFNKNTNKQENEVEIEIIKEVRHPVQPRTESKKQNSKFDSLTPNIFLKTASHPTRNNTI